MDFYLYQNNEEIKKKYPSLDQEYVIFTNYEDKCYGKTTNDMNEIGKFSKVNMCLEKKNCLNYKELGEQVASDDFEAYTHILSIQDISFKINKIYNKLSSEVNECKLVNIKKINDWDSYCIQIECLLPKNSEISNLIECFRWSLKVCSATLKNCQDKNDSYKMEIVKEFQKELSYIKIK